MDDLHYLGAGDALRRFRTKELSPVELMEAVIARAEVVEPIVNAFTVTSFEKALAQAREAADLYAADKDVRPLEGLPVALKDEVAIEGHNWSQGSLIYRDLVADHTAPIAERVLTAGGIMHARTTTPEFSCAGFTHTRLWGVTRNPWGQEWAVGGSSGGSGAALAAGTTPLASGSDIGGSIRIPASFNGVVGYKPPWGRVPGDPPFNLDTYCHDGPMGRTVADVALFENVIAGPHPNDHQSLRPKLVLPDRFEGIDGWRVALSPHLGDWVLDPEVEANTLAAGDAFREAGAIVEEVDVAITRADIDHATLVHFGAIFGKMIGDEVEQHPDLVMPYSAAIADWAAKASAQTSFHEGLVLEAKIQAELSRVLDAYDVLVCPTVATRGLVAGDDYVDDGLEVGGVQVDDYFDSMMTPPFNIASRCPVLAVPSGFASNGIPTGIQIVGRSYDDERVFRAAAAYERVRPWLDTSERRPTMGA
jgi:Asp-tRNA(Asn)/Glu-tRNA(Gln) amidotransferase A subunit family amidase